MLQQNNQNQIYVNPQLSNTFQLEVAKRLSESMADNQALELLASDILYKVGNLALTQTEILK